MKAEIVIESRKHLQELLFTGDEQTPGQEIGFSIKQIVEVAVRALSPGINDPNTAIACVRWLGSALAVISKKKFPCVIIKDDAGIVRVIKKSRRYESIVGACFDQILVYAKTNIHVMVEMMQAIYIAIETVRNQEFKNALQEKAAQINKEIHQMNRDNHEKIRMEGIYRQIMAVYSRSAP